MKNRPPYEAPPLPSPRGPVSRALLRYLAGDSDQLLTVPPVSAEVWGDEDLQLALYCGHELHYNGFDGVDDDLEWDPSVMALTTAIEEAFLEELEATVDLPDTQTPEAAEQYLVHLATSGTGPSLSRYMAETGTLEQLREFAMHRSAYQLKEADPHTWGIPRLRGEGKAAMVEIQSDEYGEGVKADMHAELFADTMQELGLDARYGRYLDRLPAVTLATCNLVTLLGLHRRWRGALVGHLALFEMTSIGPMGRYACAMDRLGVSGRAQRFYDVHVEADAVHEKIAIERMVHGLLADEPDLSRDVAFGAAALTAVEGRFARHLLDSWAAGESSLRPEVAQPADELATAV